MPASAPRAGQLPRYLRRLRLDATPLLTGDTHGESAGDTVDRSTGDPALAERYRSAEPIEWEGTAVHPLYSEQLPTAAATLTVTLLSATPPAGLAGIGIGLSMVDGYIDIDRRRLTGVDIWRDALERGITFDLSATAPGALFALTPVWANAAGEPQSWSGNYGIVVERTDSGRTVLWCSMGEGPPHFADLVVEVRSTPLDPHPQLFTPGTGVVPAVSVPTIRPGSGGPAVTRPAPGAFTTARGAADRYEAPVPEFAGIAMTDSVEPEGYPCSLADLVLRSRHNDGGDLLVGPLDTDEVLDYSSLFEDPVPGDPADLEDSGPATLLTGPEQWYTRALDEIADRAPAEPGSLSWAAAPDQTGLVPVIGGEDLPDYGPEPPRHPVADSGPSVFPLPAAYFASPRAARYRPEDEYTGSGGLSAADTVADGSLGPIADTESGPTADTPDRLHGLGTAWCASGDDEQAARLWAEAAHAGHLGATYDLGELYYRHDELDAAERWWRVAAGRRQIRAMASLADLLEQRGEIREARMWRTQAVAEEVIANAAQITDSYPVPTVEL
ncbi:MAG: sel1 repeat family protein [Nocardia sp.]|nr:sel1 repeat family protein [Nocardia sp.]